MLRLIKSFVCVGLLAAGMQSSFAFSLAGPLNSEAWQVVEIGYQLPGDTVTPKNLGEGFRRNTPVIYYSYDANFLGYFGSNGVYAIDQAMSILNGLTNVSEYSRNLAEIPTAVTRENFQASALNIYDMKSIILSMMMEQIGLAEPERYTWTLHDRFQDAPGPCPADMFYLVVKRNFDPVPSARNQYQPSSYVNGTLYSYFILEICQPPPATLAEAIEFSVDPLDTTFTAVASVFDPLGNPNSGLVWNLPGKYFTGLTRDDVGGLRYLLRKENMAWEGSGPNTLTQSTNPVPQILYTSNLTALAQQSLLTDPATLQATYPNLVISSSSNYFVTVWVTNVTPYFTNAPFDPVGTPPRVAFATNRVQTIQTRYNHTFGNVSVVVVTNGTWGAVLAPDVSAFTNQDVITLQNVTVTGGGSPFEPIGTTNTTLATNVTSRAILTNQVVGEYFILPTNMCDLAIIAPQLTIVDTVTNLIAGVTNNTGTNFSSFEQFTIDRFTNHAFLILPVLCQTSSVSLVQGIERIAFVRRDFDSLLGQFFTPLTNIYTLNTITNSTLVRQTVLRTVATPDILFTAQDLAAGPAAQPVSPFTVRTVNFATNGVGFYPNLAGPGTIEGAVAITLNKVGPIWQNASPNAYFMDTAEASQLPVNLWGSYDGTTNAPVVFPNGTTLEEIENMILIQIQPDFLAAGSVGVQYTASLTATGGQPPYTWALAPASPGLPPGLILTPDGTLSGIPLQADTFDFRVRMTDAAARVLDRDYTIVINQ